MKKLFEIPKAEILKLCAEDVVCASVGIDEITDGGEGIDGGTFNPGNDD